MGSLWAAAVWAALGAPGPAALAEKFVSGAPAERDRAGRELLAAGEPAVAALLPFLLLPDPDKRARVAHLILRVRGKALPGESFDEHGRAMGRDIVVEAGAPQKSITLNEGDRRIHIVVRAGALRVAVAASEYGEPMSVTVEAPDVATLGHKNADAAAVFQRWAGGVGLEWTIGTVTVRDRREAAPGPIMREQVELHFRRFTEQLPLQLDAAKVTPEDRAEVTALFDELVKALAEERRLESEPTSTDADIVRNLQIVFSRSHRLRETIVRLGIPDPGTALAPGAQKRLGAAFKNDVGKPLLVMRVLPQYRGERIGLSKGDRVMSVDGRTVNSVDELRRALLDAPGPITLLVERGGAHVTLKETPP